MPTIDKRLEQLDIITTIDQRISFDYSRANVILNNHNDFEQIKVEDNSSLTIIEIFDQNTKTTDIKREIKLGKNSKLEYIKICQGDSDLNFDFTIQNADKAHSFLHFFELGNGNNSNRLNTKLENEQIDIKVNALVKLKNTASAFNSFQIKHLHQNTFSDIRIRHLLDDKSKAEFEATTVIENEALFSKAFQDSKTLLLSDDAMIKARPHLEILTDELEASHGATTGGIDMDALYYLQTRGLDEKTAYKMLIDAFCKTTLEDIKDESIKEWIYEQIRI